MDKATRKPLKNQSLFHCFLSIKDPRVQGRCQYPLFNILVMTVCALIGGADDWESIALVSNERKKWLSQFIDMSFGVPSALTFARVFSLLDPDEFKQAVRAWMGQFFELLRYDVIALDGKCLRGSARKSQSKKGDHIVNAYLAKEQVVLGESRVDSKSNEIKAMPTLLKMLDIKGAIITIDAMGTQKGIANLTRIKQGHYVLALKRNHKRFYRRVDRTFMRADELSYDNMVFNHLEEKDYGHGRLEYRRYTVLPSMYFHQYKKVWRDLSAVIRVESQRYKNGEEETSVRYYITSLPFREFKRACYAIRQHWSIENNLHWKLDVGLNEDGWLASRGHAAENLSTLRKLVLKLFENETSMSHGIKMKRLRAANSCRYLRKVIGF